MTDEAGRLLQELLHYAKYCEMIAAERAATTGRLEPSDAWWGEVGVTLRGVSDLLLTQQRALAEARRQVEMACAALDDGMADLRLGTIGTALLTAQKALNAV